MIFIDTSAFIAILNTQDKNHSLARKQWIALLATDEILYTNNYIILESIALIQKRLGLSVLKKLQSNLLEYIKVDWIDEEKHTQALNIVFMENRRQLSFVDISAFATMSRLEIKTIFTFDNHFAEQGFDLLPNP